MRHDKRRGVTGARPDSAATNADRVKLTMSMSSHLRKYGLIAVVSVTLILLQSTVFGGHLIFSATPDIAFMIAIAVAFLDGAASGAVVGLCAGALSDMLGATGPSFLCLIFMLCAVATVLLGSSRLSDNFVSWLLCSAVACLVRAVVTVLQLSLMSAGYNVPEVFGRIVLPELWCTFAIGIPIYFLYKKIIRSF